MVDMTTAIRSLIQASKELGLADREMISQWESEEVPPTLRMAGFATRFVTSFDLISVSEKKRILELLEHLLEDGDYTVRESVTTGFFEALLVHHDHGRFDFSQIRTLLGQKSRAYCVAWNRFTGVEMDLGDDEMDHG